MRGSDSTHFKWRATHIETSSLTIASKKPEYLLEVKQLRKTLKEIQLELEILKKVDHVF